MPNLEVTTYSRTYWLIQVQLQPCWSTLFAKLLPCARIYQSRLEPYSNPWLMQLIFAKFFTTTCSNMNGSSSVPNYRCTKSQQLLSMLVFSPMIITAKYGFYTFGNPIAWIPKMGQVIIGWNKKLCFVFLYLGCSRGVEPSIGII